MRIKLSSCRPHGTEEPRLTYEFDGNKITTTYTELNGDTDPITDTFDFTALPDGEANVDAIETALPINPIRSAKRVDGVLYVELLHYVGSNASVEEWCPEWQEVS